MRLRLSSRSGPALGVLCLALLPPRSSPPELGARIEAYLRPYVATNNFTGVVYISRGGRVLSQRAYGLADPAFGIANTPGTRFHIASLTKSFTAAAILLLEEQGKLSTSDPVSRFLPDFPNGDRILLEHLLTHSSGVPNVREFPLSRDRYRPRTAADLVLTIREKPPEFEPGTSYSYSNSGYNLLARVIEVASGQSFGEFINGSIVAPLNLKSTVHDGDPSRVIQNLAAGTQPDGLRGVQFVPYLDWSSKTGSGSLVSSAADLCAFATALFGGKLLRPASLAKVMQPGSTFPYGWSDQDRGGHAVKTVGGRSPGFITNLEYSLDDGTCIAILTNSYSSVGQVVAPDISAIVRGKDVIAPRVGYVRPRPGGLTGFTGQFQMPEDYYASSAVLTIGDRGEYLAGTWPSGDVSVIYPSGSDDFVDRTNWAMVHFTRDGQGQVTGLRYQLLREFVAPKLPAP